MNNDELYNSHDLISETCHEEEAWANFEHSIEVIKPEELNQMSARLRAGVPDFSDWRDYANAFGEYEWFRFSEAYHYATASNYTG